MRCTLRRVNLPSPTREARVRVRSAVNRVVIWAALLALSAPVARAADLTWLTSQQNLDGSYGGTPTSLATPVQSTSEVLRAQQALGQANTFSFASAILYVSGSTDPDTELLSRKIVVSVLAGSGTDTWVADLLTRQNPDGGFGDRPGYASSVLATSFALETLAVASYSTGSAVQGAIGFLLGQQRLNGSWADGANDGSVYLTAQSMRALRGYRDTYGGVSAAITSAQNFLLSCVDPGGLWGEDFLTALVLLASASSIPDVAVLDATASALRARQLLDGSWDDDSYTTALVLQALDVYDQRKSATPSPTSGSIAGHVMKANSTEPIAGAAVTITEAPGLSVLTNADGYYVLPGLAPGNYTVTATMPGYASASAIVAVTAGQVTVAADLVLGLLPTTGLVRGLVFDAATGAPVPGAQLSLAGPAGYSVLTGSTGTFDFGPVLPGSYTLSIVASGYRTLTGSATVVAGQTLSAQVGMTAEGGFVDASPGVVQGRVVDGKSGAPIPGATFDLGAGGSALTGVDGTFAVPSVPRGSYQGTVSAVGYQTVTFTLLFSPGASGDVGTISLFPAAPSAPPTALTLHGLVVHGVTGAPISGATVTLVETGAVVTTGADGRFVLADIALKTFNLTVAATGFVSATYGVQVAAFGDANVTLQLSPPGTGAVTSTLAGLMTDAVSGAPISGAVVAIAGTGLSATTGADGRYRLAGIQPLDFSVSVSAVGYVQESLAVKLTAPGDYTLDSTLQPVAGDSFQVVSVVAAQNQAGANSALSFDVRVASLLDAPKSALVVGEIQDSSGAAVAKVTPYAAGTTIPVAEFAFGAREVKDLVVAWNTAQFAPGPYKLVLRVVEPGTINRAVPLGQVLAEGSGYTSIVPTLAVGGAISLDPPLTQAGLPTPVAFGAFVQNTGNVSLSAGDYELTITNPATNATLYVASAAAPPLDVSGTAQLAFGSWVPTDAGNLQVSVRRKAGDASGVLTGELYVGDKASGTFTVDRTVVPEGTQTVRGTVDMQGVDVSRATSTDPLFKLVKDAVTRGAAYVAPTALAWNQTNRCNGCHIQSQSLLGLSSALDKATVDLAATKYLYNAVVSSQYASGVLGAYSPSAWYQTTRTVLNAWSLGAWADPARTFRTRYKAAQYLQTVKHTAGDTTYWAPDHASGWWNTNESHTALTVKAYAGLLRDAAKISVTSQLDYTLAPGTAFGGGTVQGMTRGPDGALYLATSTGTVRRFDTASGVVTTAVSGLPSTIQGIAFSTDGTLYVTNTSNPTVIKVAVDGTRTNFSAGGYLLDGVVGPDGSLYAADFYGQRVLRVSPQGVAETYVSGGLLNGPSSVVFDEAGNLFVANQNAYDILKIAPDRSVSIYANGLANKPVRMARSTDGSLYVTTTYTEANGGAVRVLADGSVERVLQRDGVLGVVAAGPSIYFANSATSTLHLLNVVTLDTTGLESMRAEIPRGARYLLSKYTDNASDSTVHALRLVGLAEARDLVTDATLVAQIDAAIASIATLLRSRQRADGGWARYIGYPSDPLVTAMVGIALEYTNPSADDPQIRSTIQYLLNTQKTDGSWDNVYSGLSTRLASTSFVMVFMPKALERLGGIDIGLHLQLDWTVQLSNPSLAPTAIRTNADGTTDYLWQMQGVTSAGREVEFDLTLPTMALHEARPAARTAYLEFANSFVDETIQLPLPIPIVRAESQMSLALATDKPSYQADELVAISSNVANGGPGAASAEVLLAIRPAGSTFHVADLPSLPVVSLASGAQLILPTSWNTGSTLAGSYEVYGKLIDPGGRVLAETTSPFRIDAPPVVATTSVATDKPTYGGWDVVAISGRVQDAALNAVLPPSRVELTVTSPTGARLLLETRDVRQLMPGGLVDLPFQLSLADSPAGTYTVTFVLQDQFTRAVLSTSTTQFQVQRQALQGVSGTVSVMAPSVYQGDSNTCTDVTRNLSASVLPGVSLLHRVMNADTGALVEEIPQTIDLPAAGQDQVFVRDVQTRDLAVGGYACVLVAQIDGVTRTLGLAGFRVLEPPVKLAAELTLGGRGRLLVLLDGRQEEDDHEKGEGAEGHAGHSKPDLMPRRAYLEQLLRRDGWSYTITEGPKDFTRELRTGGYRIYALFSDPESLGERALLELREATFRGEGLLVVGHADTTGRWRKALGLTSIGRIPGARAIDPTTASPIPSKIDLTTSDRPLRVRRQQAESLAVYQIPPGAHDDGEHGCRSGDAPDDGPASPAKADAPGYREAESPDGKVDDKDRGDGEGPGPCLDAITLNGYGRGEAAFAGADLLAIAIRDLSRTAAADDLLTLLHLVHPASVSTQVGAVVPVQLTVANQGIAVPVTVSVSIPFGTRVVDPGEGRPSGQSLAFDFSLASGDVKTVRFWVRLPDVGGPVTIQAVVSATHGARTFTVTPSLTVAVVMPDALDVLQRRVEDLARADVHDADALKRASRALGQAVRENRDPEAIEAVLRATQALEGIDDSRVVEIHVAIDFWLRWAAMTNASHHDQNIDD